MAASMALRAQDVTVNPLSSGHIEAVSGIAQVYSDGMKLSAVAVRYDSVLDAGTLAPESFDVRYDKPVVKAYVNNQAALSDRPVAGNYVILEFDTSGWLPVNDKIADRGMGGPGGNRGPGTPGGPGGPGRRGPQAAGAAGGAVPKLDLGEAIALRGNPEAHPSISLSSRHGGTGYDVAVKQVAPLKAADGSFLEGDGAWVDNERNYTLVLDGFSKPDFTDEETGQTIKFNVFVPYAYDPDKEYPLVLYLTDEYSCENRHDAMLEKGLGPSIWATPEVQARQECFVLVPVTPKTFHTASSLEETNIPTVLKLLDKLCDMYSIDRDRLYLAGQSQAGAECIALMDAYPGRFAASLCLSGAWDGVDAYAGLKDANILFVASEGDVSGRRMVETFIDGVKHAGARVRTVRLDPLSPSADRNIRKLSRKKGNIKYILFKAGTVLPEGVEASEINEKGYTWRRAYELEAIPDWLLTRSK